MKEATLVVYNDGMQNWRGNVIDNRNGKSIYRTEAMREREQALLDGATVALDQGYKIWLAGVNPELQRTSVAA